MRIEGYLLVEHSGQYRFSLHAFETTKKIKGVSVKTIEFSGMEESTRMYDYLFSAGIEMRGHPTLHELVDQEYPLARRIYIGWKDAIYERLNREINKLMLSKNTAIKFKVGGGWVELAHVV